jgi:hypothetical protein
MSKYYPVYSFRVYVQSTSMSIVMILALINEKQIVWGKSGGPFVFNVLPGPQAKEGITPHDNCFSTIRKNSTTRKQDTKY